MLVKILLLEPAAGLDAGREYEVDEQIARGWAEKKVCRLVGAPEEKPVTKKGGKG